MQVKIYFVFSKRALNIYGTHSIALYRLGYLLIYLSYFFIEREGCIEPKNGESRRSIPRNHVICRLANW